MYQISFYVGTTSQIGETTHKGRRIAQHTTQQITENLFGVIRAVYPIGHTITDVTGGWVNSKGDYILEPTKVVTVITDNIDNIETVKNTLQVVCFQESVMVTIIKLDRVLF